MTIPSEEVERVGLLGVSHRANCVASLSIGMSGRQYRVVESSIVGGTLIEKPVDDALYDAHRDARLALRTYLERTAK